MRLKPLLLLVLLLPALSLAQSGAGSDAARTAVRAVQHLALNPVLVRAVREQNNLDLDPAMLADRDRQWRDSGDAGLKWALQESPAGQLLRRIVDQSDVIRRAYVTDSRGANVAAYPPTDDYFHGDENKWRRSFEDGRIHVMATDEDTGNDAESVQVSAPLLHRGESIGVLIVAVDRAGFVQLETP